MIMGQPAKKLSADDLLPLAKKLPRREQLRLARTLLEREPVGLVGIETRRPVEPAEGNRLAPVPDDWEPPLLRPGGTWIGGSLRREEIYGDDGR
jgi:hypothetical protein